MNASGNSRNLLILSLLLVLASLRQEGLCQESDVRFATFNVSFYGSAAGEVAGRLRKKDDSQAAAVAEIIQRVRPEVLLLNEVDYEEKETLLTLFQDNYLAIGQNLSNTPEGPAEPIQYNYRFTAPVNTGIRSGHDLDHNGHAHISEGTNEYGADCWGYGRYPGQYGMVLLSQFPIDAEAVRTFRNFRWKDMPEGRLPSNPKTPAEGDWYSDDALQKFPLSSKSHWDVPIEVRGQTIHVLASHPTPPVYDGPEDRNGRRNADEIRFWVDYITPERGDYIYDDNQIKGGLSPGERFVVMGDLNSDPQDGQGSASIRQLLSSPLISGEPIPASDGGYQQATLQGGANTSHQGDSHHDTCDPADNPGPGNLRLDYVLPAITLKAVASGVFWPKNEENTFSLVGVHPFPSSDHRLVWVDLEVKTKVETEAEDAGRN